MIFVEPPEVAADRLRLAGPLKFTLTAKQITAKKAVLLGPKPNDDYWTSLVLQVVADHGDEPIRITSVVNRVVAWGNFSQRPEREKRKVELFRLIGRLIRSGRLNRHARKYVVIPTSDERHQQYLAKFAAPVELPPPSI